MTEKPITFGKSALIGLSTLTVLLVQVSLDGKQWVIQGNANNRTEHGLWNYCRFTQAEKQCFSDRNDQEMLCGTYWHRQCLIAAYITTVVTLTSLLLTCYMTRTDKIKGLLVSILNVMCSISFLLIVTVVSFNKETGAFSYKKAGKEIRYGFTVVIAIISLLLSITSSLFATFI